MKSLIKLKVIFVGILTTISITGIFAQSHLGQKTNPLQLNDGISIGTLQETGFKEELIYAMTDSLQEGVYTNVHSVLILRNNKLVYECYFDGDDQTRGVGPVKDRKHHQDSLHDVRSVSKSIVSAAVMVALDNGYIDSIDQNVFDFFPEYKNYKSGRKSTMTIRHLLTMSSGLEWDESMGYGDPNNSELRLNNSSDPIDFFFSREIVHEPGTVFNYNGGCTQVLATIVSKSSGLSIIEFTDQYIFKPLGIKEFVWFQREDGIPIAASGVRLRSRDMAKFGLLYLNSGLWNGKQIIPSQLIEETIRAQIATSINDEPLLPRMDYSYQFWIPTFAVGSGQHSVVLATGNGGQHIIINKELNLIVVITAGNYNQWNLSGKYPEDLYTDIIYPALFNN